MTGGVGSGRENMTDGYWAQINGKRHTISRVHIRQYASREGVSILVRETGRANFDRAHDLRGGKWESLERNAENLRSSLRNCQS